MKQFIKTTPIILSIILFAGCVTAPTVALTGNESFKSISKSNSSKKKSYFLQNQMDKFLENEWKESVLEDKKIKEKYEDKKDRSFSLQEYVDKIEVYSGTKTSDDTTSNVTKLESLFSF
ncbi:MAG: hypothetical protein SPLUMA2_SPLUMAMAG2_00259 [uncultured Sulfurimonas sp.]|nr:MAG: hypothetical protein SPLUMA1_SPLUMAMAG1_00193 [uncultured Sulfurimonas sp.]CAI6152525.1 MAG: hypothetical protein SPLUMA2_SPLUMAMAG2_00259 [uncultured Sulfurimonas sp.]